MKQALIHGLLGFTLALIIMKMYGNYADIHPLSRINLELKQYLSECSLLGDVGGTNIRLQLAMIKPRQNQPQILYKKVKLSVSDYDSLKDAIQYFLIDAPCYPSIAAIAIAGPINDNSVKMANVPKWGTIYGNQLAKQLNIKSFRLINDFQAVSYGILILSQNDIIYINDRKIIETKTRGVMGPGTGLGHSIVYLNPTHFLKRAYVLPSQAGHADFSLVDIDDETSQFFTFLKKQMNINYVSMQRSCSGPTIPYMYKFYARKYPELQGAFLDPTPQQIVNLLKKQNKNNSLASMTIQLFLKFYGNAIGNFMVHHMPLGGVYLVGSLTQAIIPYILQKDILKQFKERHPEIRNVIQNIPLVFSKQVDLGLKGSFVYARRFIRDKQVSNDLLEKM